MTLKDIAIFKQFIRKNDLRKPFINGYKRSLGFAKNPANIEDYFANVDATAVITKAIRKFSPNETYGFDFWQGINEDWLRFYAKWCQYDIIQKGDKELYSLKNIFSILRENWKNEDKPWRFESVPDTCKRLGIDLPPECRATDEKKEEDAPVEQPQVDEEKEDEDDIEFFDITPNCSGRGGILLHNEASVNFRSNSYRILFSQKISEMIRETNMQFARLGQKQGELILQLNNIAGNKLALKSKDDKYNVTLNSKEISLKLKDFFGRKEDYFVIVCENIKQTENFINFKITVK